MHGRSSIFHPLRIQPLPFLGGKGNRNDHRHTECPYGDGFYVGLIRNFHGPYGCGNPEMEEVVWTEVHQVQKTDDLHQAQKSNLMKRPAACMGIMHGGAAKVRKRR